MIVTKAELISYVDIDSTLIRRIGYSDLVLNYYGMPYHVSPIDENIEFLKSLKARGHYIVVHSNNGWQWAEEVIKALKLEEYVDEVKTKPTKVVDDEPASAWIPFTINLDPKRKS